MGQHNNFVKYLGPLFPRNSSILHNFPPAGRKVVFSSRCEHLSHTYPTPTSQMAKPAAKKPAKKAAKKTIKKKPAKKAAKKPAKKAAKKPAKKAGKKK